MNQDLVTSNSLLYNIANDRQLLSSRGKLNVIPVVPKNQTTDIVANRLEIQNSYIENPGFPDFVEMVQ